jgi:hypothetical protein
MEMQLFPVHCYSLLATQQLRAGASYSFAIFGNCFLWSIPDCMFWKDMHSLKDIQWIRYCIILYGKIRSCRLKKHTLHTLIICKVLHCMFTASLTVCFNIQIRNAAFQFVWLKCCRWTKEHTFQESGILDVCSMLLSDGIRPYIAVGVNLPRDCIESVWGTSPPVYSDDNK